MNSTSPYMYRVQLIFIHQWPLPLLNLRLSRSNYSYKCLFLLTLTNLACFMMVWYKTRKEKQDVIIQMSFIIPLKLFALPPNLSFVTGYATSWTSSNRKKLTKDQVVCAERTKKVYENNVKWIEIWQENIKEYRIALTFLWLRLIWYNKILLMSGYI